MELREKVLSALRWSAAARFLGQAFSWAITILVIRMLTPGDYGLMAMATVLVSFLFLLNTLGLDAILIQQKDLQEHTRRQIFGVVILANCACFGLLFMGAPLAAAFFDEPSLSAVVRVLSVQFLLLIFETLPQAQLEREIDFARRSVVDFVTLVLGSLVTLVLALLGYGVWALVWGMLATTASRVIGLNMIARSLVWPSFSFGNMSAHFSFGAFVSTDRGLWYLFSESDKFIGGKLLGQHALGFYAVAAQLASLPIQKLAGLLNAVALPAFSRVHSREDAAAVRPYLLTATRLLSIAAVPVFFGLSCAADPIVAVLLGEKWMPVAPLLQLLGLVMPFKLLSNVFPPLLWGIGQPRVSAINYAIAAIIMPLAFAAGALWAGALGMAYAWLAAYPLVFLITAWRSCNAAGISVVEYLGELRKPVIAGVLMYVVVLYLGDYVHDAFSAGLRLLILAGTGAAVYLALMFFIDRSSLLQTWALLKPQRAR